MWCCIVISAVLSSFCFLVSGEMISDGTNDVFHYTNTGSGWLWQQNIANKPYLDITELSAEISNDNNLSVTLRVKGNIQNSDKLVYWVYCNTTDTTYQLYWTNNIGIAHGALIDENGTTGNLIEAKKVTAADDTIKATFDILGNTTVNELWAWSSELSVIMESQQIETWGDWAPDTYFPYNQDLPDDALDDNDSQPKDTPGFEMLLVVLATIFAIIIFNKRK